MLRCSTFFQCRKLCIQENSCNTNEYRLKSKKKKFSFDSSFTSEINLVNLILFSQCGTLDYEKEIMVFVLKLRAVNYKQKKKQNKKKVHQFICRPILC